MTSIFGEIGILLILATAFALVARLFKQPPLIGYILTGVFLGPFGAHALNNPELLVALRDIGIALLLFLVGLELDWSKAKHQLHTASALSIIQVVGSFALGVPLALLTGHSLMSGIYVGLALSFASTVVVIKVFSESRDLNSLHGRISVGILLFQDGLAIAALTFLGGFSVASSLSPAGIVLLLILKVISVLGISWVASQYILPALFARIARSSELLFLSSLAWCFIMSLGMEAVGFPSEVGALIAGVTLASLPYSLDILNKVRSLRDFFVILLFVGLGTTVTRPEFSAVGLMAGMLVLTVIGKPILSFFALINRGYTSRTSFMAALTQGQISEFSLILVAAGITYHQISASLASAITITGILSLFLSTVILTNRIRLYNKVRGLLKHFERSRRHRHLLEGNEERLDGHIVIFGYHHMGYHILTRLQELGHRVLVVDFNPDIVKKLKAENIECRYGDVQDEELLDELQIERTSLVISTVPHREETEFLLDELHRRHAKGLFIVTANHIDDALNYYKRGASYVILPHILGGEYVASLLSTWKKHGMEQIGEQREEEIKLLTTKKHALYYE